jgi:methyl-accepting chemotaxis protein
MYDAAIALAGQYKWLASMGVAVLVTIALCYRIQMRGRNRLLQTAFDNMSQGLCMWSPTARLVLCNERYIQMYDLTPDLVRPGISLREVLDHRINAGTFSGDRDQYITDLLSSIANGKTVTNLREHNGRFIAIANRPMGDGGWVATHEDVTEQRMAEIQRASMQELESRRTLIDDAIREFRDRIESALKTVSESANAMKSTAVGLLGSSEQTSQAAQGALQASTDASANVRSAATAANELASSIAEISQQLVRTTNVVSETVSQAAFTNEQVAGLFEAAQKIGDVVELIGEIAGQTNLLALNATIEAARAGEAGRGFAVVASEVKSLAVQTAKATEEISTQIRAVQDSTGSAVEAIRGIAGRMHDVSAYTSSVASSVEQQNAATGEISHSVEGAAEGTAKVASVLGDVAGAAIATRTSAESVLSASRSVESAVNRMRSEVDSFLAKVAI